MPDEFARDIQKVDNFESLVDFLRDSLNWPIPDAGLEFEDITYQWSAIELDLNTDTDAKVIACRQLQLYDLIFNVSVMDDENETDAQARQQLLVEKDVLERSQSWGIFFIQFDDSVELDACKTLLRRVLRGLVNRRGRSVTLPF